MTNAQPLVELLAQGKIQNFTEFAAACGGLMMGGQSLQEMETQRDYHLQRVKIDTKDLELTQTLDVNGIIQESEILWDSLLETNEFKTSTFNTRLDNLNKAIVDAKKFTPPTEDFINFRQFLIDSLEAGVKMVTQQLNNEIPEPKRLYGEEWRKDRIKMLEDAIDTHSKLGNNLKDRIENIKIWFDTLAKELGIVEKHEAMKVEQQEAE